MRRSIKAAVAASVTALAVLSATPALATSVAAPEDVEVGDALAVLADAAPEVLVDRADVATTTDEALTTSTASGQSGTVHLDAGDGVVVDGRGTDRPAVQIELPFAETSDDGVVVGDGVVAFDNNNDSLTVPVLKDDGSVQVTTIIESASAAERYDYQVTTAEDSQLRLESDGTVTILTGTGEYAGSIAAAWAKDATGAVVPTHYEISGTTLTQVVEHTTAAVQYPVTADPWLGIDMIASTRWTYHTGAGWRLSVTATDWGKVGAGTGARWAAWDEVKAKTSGTRENTQVYEKQLLCHFDGRLAVIAREGYNATWDLEGWRPNVSYLAYVQALCNP